MRSVADGILYGRRVITRLALALVSLVAAGAAGYALAPAARTGGSNRLEHRIGGVEEEANTARTEATLVQLKLVQAEVGMEHRLQRLEGCLPELVNYTNALSDGRDALAMITGACMHLFYPEGVPLN